MFYSPLKNGFYDPAIHGDNIPADAVEITDTEHQALLDGQSAGKLIQADIEGRPTLADRPPPTPEQIVAQYTGAVQQHLDTFARTRNYDGILSACTYATGTVPKFKAEGQYAVEARDATWSKSYEIMAEVQSGTRQMPTIEELISELPALAWPA